MGVLRRWAVLASLLVLVVASLPSAPLSGSGTAFAAPSGTGVSYVERPPTAGDGFGEQMVALATGNVVVTDPSDATAVGAVRGGVHLFDGATGERISSNYGLLGVRVFALPDGSYVVTGVLSSDPQRSVVARCDGRVGCPAVLDASTSWVAPGFSPAGAHVVPLAAGGWVMTIPEWREGGQPVGASIACPAPGWCSGTRSAANFLAGGPVGSGAGMRAVATPDGGYVVAMPWWRDGVAPPATQLGAVVRCPSSGCAGVVSRSNAVFGTPVNGLVGEDVEVLGNGAIVIGSLGRSAYCAPMAPCVGAIDTMADQVQVGTVSVDVTPLPNGSYLLARGQVWCPSSGQCASQGRVWPGSVPRAYVLTDGNYVLAGLSASNNWIVQWCDGAVGCGAPEPAHSFSWRATDVTPLTGGRFVVSDPTWQAAPGETPGAIVVCPRFGCTSASSADVLRGPSATSQIGSGGVRALPNGGFVVSSPYWTDSPEPWLGSVMWCGPGQTCSGVMTRDRVVPGNSRLNKITVLADGSYVVTSPGLSLGTIASRWCPADRPCVGPMTDMNSMLFDRGNDFGAASDIGVWPISGDTYVVSAAQPITASVGAPPYDTYVMSADRTVGRSSVVVSDIRSRVVSVVSEPVHASAWIRTLDGLVYRWSPRNSPAPTPAGPGFVGLSPARLADTRPWPGLSTVDGHVLGIGELRPGTFVEIPIVARGVVPADARAVSLNVTVTEPERPGFVTVWPCGPQPNTSNVNFVARQTVANSVTVAVSQRGTICASSNVPTHLVVDVVAAFRSTAEFGGLTPSRLVETRMGIGLSTVDGQHQGQGRLRGGIPTAFAIAGRAGIAPSTSSILINATVVNPSGDGFLTLWPCGPNRPNASTLNFAAGATIAGAATVQLGSGGQICAFSNVDTDLVIDAFGTVASSAAYVPVTPARMLETRTGPGLGTIDGISNGTGPARPGETITVPISGRAGTPATATSATLTIIATESGGVGYVTVWPCDAPRPVASTLNITPGATVANSLIARLDPQGRVCLSSSTDTHLVVDISGSRS